MSRNYQAVVILRTTADSADTADSACTAEIAVTADLSGLCGRVCLYCYFVIGLKVILMFIGKENMHAKFCIHPPNLR